MEFGQLKGAFLEEYYLLEVRFFMLKRFLCYALDDLYGHISDRYSTLLPSPIKLAERR
jgi:hypothetical protein